jgi:uncharacterized protein involved in exopolysaccharide biosynthesis
MNVEQANDTMNSHEEEEISLLDLLTVLGEQKKFILGMSLFFAIVAALVSLFLTPIYTARTLFMPPQQQSSGAASMLASLGGLAGLAGGAAGIKSPDEMYIALMKSDTALNHLIQEHDLQRRYESKTLMDTRKVLLNRVRVVSDKKSGLISVEVDDFDPTFSATLANSFVAELSRITDRFAVTDAQQRRVFFENQIVKTQEKLSKDEARFREAQGRSGLQMPSINADTSLKNIAELHGQIAAREIQLQAIDRFATSKNPEVQKLTSELTAMRMTLLRLEQGSGVSSFGPIQQDAMSAYREMKTSESMLEAFVKQLELARIDESKEGPLIQVVDTATPQERRSSPKRTLIVLISLFTGFFISLLIVFVRQSIRSLNNDPESSLQLSRLKAAWKL